LGPGGRQTCEGFQRVATLKKRYNLSRRKRVKKKKNVASNARFERTVNSNLLPGEKGNGGRAKKTLLTSGKGVGETGSTDCPWLYGKLNGKYRAPVGGGYSTLGWL